MGRDDLDCAARVAAIEREAQAVDGPIVLVAHSGGCVMVAHWARQTHAAGARRPAGHAAGLRATDARGLSDARRARAPTAGCRCRASGCRSRAWWPPAATTRWAATSASSELARDWGSRLVDLGFVGHLNPARATAAGRRAERFIERRSAARLLNASARTHIEETSMAKAIRLHETGGPEVLEARDGRGRRARPRPGARAPQLRGRQLHRHLLPHRPLSAAAAQWPGLRCRRRGRGGGRRRHRHRSRATVSATCSGRKAPTPTCA